MIDYRYKYHKYKIKYLQILDQTGGANKKRSNKTNKHKYNKDNILGSLYGACIGDSLGTRYEFLESHKATELLDQDLVIHSYLPLLGEGPFNTRPGQISDDSEMMLSLLGSIFHKKTYDQEDVAQQYIKWFGTKPIDIGNTIKRSLFTRKHSESNLDMIRNSKELNNTSLSNGVLMRATPLGVLGLKIKDKDLKRVVSQECDLTHPNKIIKDAVYMYCLAIKHILLGVSKKDVYTLLLNKVSEPRVKIVIRDSWDVREPIYMIDDLGQDRYINADSKRYQGYFGVALQLALYELFNGSDFTDSMINIIKLGGDVDTNCCIAGGLLGAYYGLSKLDNRWIKSVKNSDNSRVQQYAYLSPNVIDGYISKMFKK